jgi:ubiquitin-protein ligase
MSETTTVLYPLNVHLERLSVSIPAGSGRLKLTSAIQTAAKQLLAARAQFPAAQLRIVIIAKGFDSEVKKSKWNDWFSKGGIVLDGIAINSNTGLSKLCQSFGGVCFSGSKVSKQSHDLVDQEAFIDPMLRWGNTRSSDVLPNSMIEHLNKWRSCQLRTTSNLDDHYFPRLEAQLERIREAQGIRVGFTDSPSEWFIAFSVTNRWYQVVVEFPHDFPYRPPTLFFVPPIAHQSVNQYDGRARLSILADGYNANVTVLAVIRQVIELVETRSVVQADVHPNRYLRT